MNLSSRLARLRSRVLQSLFQLLYTRFGFLHETIGRVVYGAAWHGRRRHVVPLTLTGTLVDLGCGEGRLLRTLPITSVVTIGVEPTGQMSRRAKRHAVEVVQAPAQSLPLRNACVKHVIATYPGPWIVDARTWDEIARVSAPDATVAVLLGGDITRGRCAMVRSTLMRIAYGRQGTETSQLPVLGNRLVTGKYVLVDDEWGTAILWCGQRDA